MTATCDAIFWACIGALAYEAIRQLHGLFERDQQAKRDRLARSARQEPTAVEASLRSELAAAREDLRNAEMDLRRVAIMQGLTARRVAMLAMLAEPMVPTTVVRAATRKADRPRMPRAASGDETGT
jgi:hypothetical protein